MLGFLTLFCYPVCMSILLSKRQGYSYAERLSDTIIHVIGLAAVAIAVPILIGLVVLERGDWASITAVSVYGASLTAMLISSAIYNISTAEDWAPIFKRMDHSAIYMKIAGTYTPLVALTGGAGLPFLAGLWTAALGGTSMKIIAPNRLRWLGLTLYLGMGWAGVFAGADVIDGLTGPVLTLVIIGGLLYTLGVVFFLWEALPFHNTIWHGFVLVASICLYAAILVQLVSAPGLPPA
jgi:hemolysin III